MDRLISANAYLGADALLPALQQQADVVIAGRIADPALFLAPLMHHFGWQPHDWPRMGQGIVVGHLLECAAQVSGGYIADPGFVDVPDLADVGFPLAEVDGDGSAVITKLAGTGGRVDRLTCTAQLLYELEDPQRYLQPDVVADFSQVRFEDIGPDRVRVTRRQRPCTARPAQGHAGLPRRLHRRGPDLVRRPGRARTRRAGPAGARSPAGAPGLGGLEHRLELIGVNAMHGPALGADREPYEVRVRLAAALRRPGPGRARRAGGRGPVPERPGRRWRRHAVGARSGGGRVGAGTARRASRPVARSWSCDMTEIRDIALARSGDKGNRATLSVIARDPAHYPLLERTLSAERVKAFYQGVVHGAVTRYPLPHLGAVHFVMHEALGGGVTRSLALDAHGKTLGAAVLDIEIAPELP